MPERGARPCRIMGFWGLGGYALGFLTALMGRDGIIVCTAAVEDCVHVHLDDQSRYLAPRDAALHALIAGIRVDEMAHLEFARWRLPQPSLAWRAVDKWVRLSTETVIWLSTWGDSSRMKRDLASI